MTFVTSVTHLSIFSLVAPIFFFHADRSW
jgi:hypothetical protein